MNLNELKATREALRTQLAHFDSIVPKCADCTHLMAGRCEVFDSTPPDNWVRGPVECEQWHWDGIPF